MQTMDMIVVKKKRIALIERDAGSRNNSRHTKENPSGVWSMLRSVTSVGSSNSESEFIKLVASYDSIDSKICVQI